MIAIDKYRQYDILVLQESKEVRKAEKSLNSEKEDRNIITSGNETIIKE